jgi:hypothetical protein
LENRGGRPSDGKFSSSDYFSHISAPLLLEDKQPLYCFYKGDFIPVRIILLRRKNSTFSLFIGGNELSTGRRVRAVNAVVTSELTPMVARVAVQAPLKQTKIDDGD